MARFPIIRRGDMLLPANPEALEAVRALPLGRELGCDVVQLRNAALHRKAFAFVKLSFDYWQPKNHVQSIEKQTVGKLGRFLVGNGLDADTVRTLCKQFLHHLNDARRGLVVAKDFESFRQFITIEAGFYKLVITPAGPRKEAKSWAYKNMAQADFENLFSAIRRVCWDLVLSQTFSSIEEADAVAEQLMNFD